MQVDIPSPSQQFGITMSLKRMRSASPSPSTTSPPYSSDPDRVHRPAVSFISLPFVRVTRSYLISYRNDLRSPSGLTRWKEYEKRTIF